MNTVAGIYIGGGRAKRKAIHPEERGSRTPVPSATGDISVPLGSSSAAGRRGLGLVAPRDTTMHADTSEVAR